MKHEGRVIPKEEVLANRSNAYEFIDFDNCKDCNKSLEDCTCINDTLDMKQETLEEQIRPHTQYWDCYNDCPLEYNHTGKVLKIIDLFTIDFLDWLTNEKSKYAIMYGDQDKRFSTFENDYTSKELLQLYKKEKGL